MSERTVKVKTRFRTMSGARGGMIRTFPAAQAKDWIERRWADPVPNEETKALGGFKTSWSDPDPARS